MKRICAASKIRSGSDYAHVDYVLASENTPLMVSFFERSQLTVKALGASFNSRNLYMSLFKACEVGSLYSYNCDEGFHVFYSQVEGYDPFYNCLAVNKLLHKRYLVTSRGQEEQDFFSFLMENYDLPLLKEWSGELWHWAKTCVCDEETGVLYMPEGNEGRELRLPDGRNVSVEDLLVYEVRTTADELEKTVSELLSQNMIRISQRPQKSLAIEGMDDYFSKYGGKIVKNLKEQLSPLTDYTGETDGFTLKHKRLYPQQIAMVSGATALLVGTGNKRERRKNHSRYAILNEGMGCGKTLQGAAICEAVEVAKLLRKGEDLKEIYSGRDVNYRNIIMCPGHLVEKWASEIASEVPYARTKVLRTFEDLLEVWKDGAERKEKEFFVMSKDFAKLSYSEKPVPTRYGRRKAKTRKCAQCGRTMKDNGTCSCGCTKWNVATDIDETEVTGMICPRCNNVLTPSNGRKRSESGEPMTLQPYDFARKTSSNERCFFCGETLWMPHVRNIGEELKKSKWRKISHFANKAKKGMKTAWVHADFIDDYLRKNDVEEGEYRFLTGEGVRRVDPAGFIKKHMKGYFDIAIFDEVHNLKGGDTAQGHAMHALVKASRRQLALTGTIAGGCAHHLFYLLYRLDPGRMKREGFEWTDVSKFSQTYGSVETVYEAVPNYTGEYNVNSRGRKLSEPKVMPGISPLIFTKFLLDKAVMLDITDMSSHLPPLHENVVLVDAETKEELEAQRAYRKVVEELKELSRGGYGMTVLSTMLQFSLSYLDKPYGVEPMLDPLTGQMMCKPENFDYFSDTGHLLAKEERLVELVKEELSENRNCFVYAEYTNSPQTCVSGRIRDILKCHVGLGDKEVVVLDSNTVSAAEREEWIHEKAKAGMKVCIVNPKCVETGLDFCFTHEGVSYNYPSIIFYQLGYSLFTIWQASRRHYRLNQKEECRTYYMAYSGTVQEVVISLIAEKMAATSAIQGKFSAEGLTAMAQGVDTRVRLAQSLSDMDKETGKELQGMFDVINNVGTEDENAKYKPMLLLRDILGEDAALERTTEEIADAEESNFDIFDILEFMSEPVEPDVPEEAEPEVTEAGQSLPVPAENGGAPDGDDTFSLIEFLTGVAVAEAVVTRTAVSRSRRRNQIVAGQMMLF